MNFEASLITSENRQAGDRRTIAALILEEKIEVFNLKTPSSKVRELAQA